MNSLKHFVTEIAPKTWCLSEFNLVNTFLVEGEERAALIDTGCGIGNLYKCVRELTDKPLVVLLTHAHFDHDGGIQQFKDFPIYLNENDGKNMDANIENMKKLFGTSDLNEARRFYIRTRGPIRCPEIEIDELYKLVPETSDEYRYDYIPLEDGMDIDLGDRLLHAIHTPGHTDGEMCILDVQSRILFSGDTANKGIILMRQPDNGNKLIKICNNTMKKLWDIEDKYDVLGVGHDAVTMSKQIIKDYFDLTTGLLDGSITGSYEESGFRKGDVARLGLAELWYQCDA